MNDPQLNQQALQDLAALAQTHERISLEIRPIDAFFMLSYLQLALRNQDTTENSAARVEYLGRRLQDLVARTPSLVELCERGWNEDVQPINLDPHLWVSPFKDAIDRATNQLIVAGGDVFMLRNTSHVTVGLAWPNGGDQLRDLELMPPHPLVVLAVFPTSDGGPAGIETR